MRQVYDNLRQDFKDRLTLLDKSLVARNVHFREMQDKVSVAIGVRRSGKTYVMYEKIQTLLAEGISLDRILYLNLEDDRLYPKEAPLLSALLDYFYQDHPEHYQQKIYLFFDEIQEIEDWAAVIRRLLDTKHCDIYLTGSSAKLLSREIASSMRGRSLSTEVWPFDFREYLSIKNINIQEHNASQKSQDILLVQLRNYLLTGGFPEIVLHGEIHAQSVLQEYVDVAIFRDVVERHNIQNVPLIRYLVRTLLMGVASPFSINKFFNDLKSQGYLVGKTTLHDYLGYLSDCYLAFTAPLYAESARRVQVNPRKIYAVDTGMAVAYQYGYSNNIGRLFENLLYLDLKREGAQVFYYKTMEGYEVDFVAVYPDNRRKLVQVAWDVSDPATLERETRALEAAKAELQLEGELVTPKTYFLNLIG